MRWIAEDGRTVTFAAADVLALSFGGSPSTAPAVAAPQVAVAASPRPIVLPALEPGPGRTRIRFVSTGRSLEIGIATVFLPHLNDDGVSLVERGAGPALCATPCALYVSHDSVPMWAGHAGFMFYNFPISAFGSDEVVRLRAARSGPRGWAPPMIVVGVLSAIVGGVLVSISRPGTGEFFGSAVTVGGGVSLLAGAVLIYELNRGGIDASIPIPHTITSAPRRRGTVPLLGFHQVDQGAAVLLSLTL